MNHGIIKVWNELTPEEKQEIFREVGNTMGLPAAAIEKDWWITQTLALIFTMDIGAHTVFKGGTSLSKAWRLIDRFSEDIDLALDRKFLGFDEEMSPSQVRKLRKHSFQYISESFFPALQKVFQNAGFRDIKIQLSETKANDQDPLIIEIYYPGNTTTLQYLQPKVLVEIGSRSLREPFSEKDFCSFVGEQFAGKSFADTMIKVPTVNPERTFLEKIFLLHEEFQKPAEKVRVNRLSRHLYDLEKLMDTSFGEKALSDNLLYYGIVEHRKNITPIKGIDYANHSPEKINPIPPPNIIEYWRKDYKEMQESMFYKDSLPFDTLLERINILKKRINTLS